jgi:hypothetical protein
MVEMTRRSFLDGAWTVLTLASSLSLSLRDLHAQELLIACTGQKPSPENLQRMDLTKPDPRVNDIVRNTVLDCYNFFHVKPAFYYVNNDRRYYYNAFADPNNADAVPRNNQIFGYVSGEIGFGLPYLQRSLSKDPIGDDVMRIIAHEFGHILQYNILYPDNHLLYSVLHPDGATAKRVELHADLISGVYLAIRYAHDRHHDMSILNSTIEGDNDRASPNHHGTTTERRQAFRYGFTKGLSFDSISPNDLFQLTLSSAGYIMSEFE